MINLIKNVKVYGVHLHLIKNKILKTKIRVNKDTQSKKSKSSFYNKSNTTSRILTFINISIFY